MARRPGCLPKGERDDDDRDHERDEPEGGAHGGAGRHCVGRWDGYRGWLVGLPGRRQRWCVRTWLPQHPAAQAPVKPQCPTRRRTPPAHSPMDDLSCGRSTGNGATV
jgi:hypothetical protein